MSSVLCAVVHNLHGGRGEIRQQLFLYTFPTRHDAIPSFIPLHSPHISFL